MVEIKGEDLGSHGREMNDIKNTVEIHCIRGISKEEAGTS